MLIETDNSDLSSSNRCINYISVEPLANRMAGGFSGFGVIFGLIEIGMHLQAHIEIIHSN